MPAAKITGPGTVTVMEDTVEAGVTVRVSGPLVTLAAEAVICVEPARRAVARPLLSMVATLVLLLDQVKVTPLMVLPEPSLAVAVNCCVAPTAMEGEDGETVMDATTGAVTVRVSGELVTPPAEAVI